MIINREFGLSLPAGQVSTTKQAIAPGVATTRAAPTITFKTNEPQRSPVEVKVVSPQTTPPPVDEEDPPADDLSPEPEPKSSNALPIGGGLLFLLWLLGR